MMQWLIISIIAIIIGGLTYLATIIGQSDKSDKSDKAKQLNKIKAGRRAVLAGLAAGLASALAFAGSYIVEPFKGSDEEKVVEDMEGEELIDIPAEHEHKVADIKKENVVPATCLESGSYESVSYCECGEELERKTVIIDALGHDYKKTITQRSCEKDGFTTYKCSRCNDSYEGDFLDAWGHDFVDGICSRCGSVDPDYEILITSQANELVKTGNYDEAIELVDGAAGRIESETLQQLCQNIQVMQGEAAKLLEYTVPPVNFITYTGTIEDSDDADVYELTALVDGNYRFDFEDMIDGFEVGFAVSDVNGKWINGTGRYYGLGSGEGYTVELEKGCDYTVDVKYYSNGGNYTLKIGQPKEAVDITDRECVYDSIEYMNQKNEYIFIPPIDGVYRFDFQDVVNNLRFDARIYNSLGYEVKGYKGIGNKSGITVRLVAGEIYKVQVGQYEGKGSYTLKIGKQKPVLDISGKKYVKGKITFTEQETIYTYTPLKSKEYIFSLDNMENGFRIGFKIRDSLDYEIGGYNNMGNGSESKAELTAGETYKICVTQYEGGGNYTINIWG